MSPESRPTVKVLRELGDGFQRLPASGGPRSGRARALAIAAGVAMLIGAVSFTPPGRAVAEDVGSLFEGSDNPDGLIPAVACAPQVIDAYAEQGLRFDTYSSCSDLDQATERARAINHMRRNGLTKLLEGMRAYGAPANVRARVAAELEQLGGPWVYPRDR